MSIWQAPLSTAADRASRPPQPREIYFDNEANAFTAVLPDGTIQPLDGSGDFDPSELIALGSPVTVTGSTALPATALNARIICAAGSGSYTVNLPPVTTADSGKGVLLAIDRANLGVVTIQAAPGSGLNVDGNALRDMISGESALFIYDGSIGWRRQDYTARHIVAMLQSNSSTTLTIGSFTSVPVPGAGRQLMEQDLSALWNPTGGYFTAPRAGTYTFDVGLWLAVTGGPAQIDIGAYVGDNPGGTPGDPDFVRHMSDGLNFERRIVTFTFSMNKGGKFFPAVRVASPATAATVSSGVVSSTITVVEHPR